MAVWRCPLCAFFAVKLIHVVNHVAETHSSETNFAVLCGVDGCCHLFKAFNSYCRHLYRKHRVHLGSDVPISNPGVVRGMGPHANLPHNKESSVHQLQDNAATPTAETVPGRIVVETYDQFVRDLQASICLFFFQLAEKLKVPHKTCENIFGDFQSLPEVIVKKHAEQIHQASPETNAPLNSHGIFGGGFPSCLFDKVKSSYQRAQFATKNFLYVKPEQMLSNAKSSSYHYVPIGKVIENLLKVPQLSANLPQPTKQAMDKPEVLQCFRDGIAFRQQSTNAMSNEPVHNLHVILSYLPTQQC